MTGARPHPRLLFISLDPVGEQMAGLGIRYTELARALAPVAEVTLAAPGARAVDDVATVDFTPHRPEALREPIAAADAIVTHPQWPVITRWMTRSKARLIYDLYDPETLETLELFAGRSAPRRRLMVDLTLDRLYDALSVGDQFICASEKQRDLWLGAMLARDLIEPDRYDADPTFRSVIDLVPFGVPSLPPRRDPRHSSIRDRFAQIADTDEIVLWNGGLWRWLDAPTAIRAVALLAKRRPGVRLVFMGGSDSPAALEATTQARAVAESLGELDSTVLFNDAWVPYAERANWLLDASCALSTHRDHLETRYAFRTRLLDCFWAGLPVVCTRGDDLSDRVAREGLGAAVPAGSDADTADALETVLDRGRASYTDALASAARDHVWDTVAAPIAHWIAMPRSASGNRRRRRRKRSVRHRLRAGAYTIARWVLPRSAAS
jgi:glycosyltransferase involved in cell wall biosynthesis